MKRKKSFSNKPISEKTYENYKKLYQGYAKNNPMKTPEFSKWQVEQAMKQIRRDGHKNPARFIAQAQRMYSTPQIKSTVKFVKDLYKELNQEFSFSTGTYDEKGKEIIIKFNGLEKFKERFPQFAKGKFKRIELLQQREAIFSFLRSTLQFTTDDVEEIFSPKER